MSTMDAPPEIAVRPIQDAHDVELVRTLFEEYAQSLEVDLAFQQFEDELAQLPGVYAEPAGFLLLAFVDGLPAGCCAIRPLPGSAISNASEMKRLYVRKLFRGLGLGRMLAQTALEAAKIAGYSCVLLDTLDTMQAARALYEDLGFEETEPYYFNPHPDAFFLKADIN